MQKKDTLGISLIYYIYTPTCSPSRPCLLQPSPISSSRCSSLSRTLGGYLMHGMTVSATVWYIATAALPASTGGLVRRHTTLAALPDPLVAC